MNLKKAFYELMKVICRKDFGSNKIENFQLHLQIEGSFLDYRNALEIAAYCSELLKFIEIFMRRLINTHPYKKVENITMDNGHATTDPQIELYF